MSVCPLEQDPPVSAALDTVADSGTCTKLETCDKIKCREENIPTAYGKESPEPDCSNCDLLAGSHN